MTFSTAPRFLATCLALMLAVSACGGSDETATTATTTTTESTTTEPTSTESTTTTVDDRTDEERAIDQLDLMLVQLRTDDLIATADCVVERLKSEGIEIVGQGAPELVAALGCDPGVGDLMFRTDGLNVTEEQGSCIVDTLVDEVSMVPLLEAEAFFSAPAPPEDMLQTIADSCDVPFDELNQVFTN